MSSEKVRLASLGLGWWSDELADAVGRAEGGEIISCFTRSKDKREAFAKKFDCYAASNYDEILTDPQIDGIINTTPNNVHLETNRSLQNLNTSAQLDW